MYKYEINKFPLKNIANKTLIFLWDFSIVCGIETSQEYLKIKIKRIDTILFTKVSFCD